MTCRATTGAAGATCRSHVGSGVSMTLSGACCRLYRVRAVAMIPARGGSKRIPGKNIKSFEGLPIIAFAIRAALESNCFHEVMVSTDSDEIANVARRFGASVPFKRSARASDDHATTATVLLEVSAEYAARGQGFDLGCCIYPCNPFLTPDKLRTARATLEREGFDCVFSAVRYGYPPQRAFVVEQQRMRLLHPEHIDRRSQDLAPILHDAAQFYWFRTESLRRNGRLWTDNTGVIELPEAEVQDIDTDADWQLAELKHRIWTATRS
jgi:pseudaminic acid cytidylyltransferase